MRNVTITLKKEVAAWLRVAAAKEGKSVSRYVSDRIEKEMVDRERQLKLLDRFLHGPGYPGVAADWPTRDDIHDC